MQYKKLYLEDLSKAFDTIPNYEIINGSNILVTGATGLIGSAIVDMLILANDIKNLNNKVYAGARNQEKFKSRYKKLMNRKDLLYLKYDATNDINSEIGFDYIIHAASPASPNLYSTRPVETMLANFIGLANILKYAKTYNSKRVCYISSSEVYGKKEEVSAYAEEDYAFFDILNPRACYPSSKRAAETLMAAYYKEYGVYGVIVRPAYIFGPTLTEKDTRASSAFFTDVLDGRNIIMKSEGLQIRSYCYVIDAAAAILTAMINGSPSQAYNIGNPNAIASIIDLAKEIAYQAGREINFEIPTDEEKKSYNMMDNSILDSRKLTNLGWRPLFDLKTGVKHTLDILE